LSIYIAITTLEDPDIVGTVSSALTSANNPEEIHVGVAAAVSDTFFNKISSLLNFDQLTLKQFDQDKANGIGRARNLSRFAYSDEDFILQVDSHTYFRHGWDTTLINLFNYSVSVTGNNKTVLTGSLGKHEIVNGRPEIYSDEVNYSVITNATWSPYTNINHWMLIPVSKFPESIDVSSDIIIPANKVNGNFIFSNGSFADFSGLPDSAVYFDEEIIQTINLLENGFSLVHPNTSLPITHRYKVDGEAPPRQDGRDIFWNDSITHDLVMTSSMFDFIYNNPEACKRYFDYSKYDVVTKMVKPFYIPESFSYLRP
jgi:hypothetical protein